MHEQCDECQAGGRKGQVRNVQTDAQHPRAGSDHPWAVRQRDRSPDVNDQLGARLPRIVSSSAGTEEVSAVR